MTVLIIDRDTQFCSKVCDVLKETNPGLEYEIALKSSDRLQEWDLRYTSAINSLTLKMKHLIQDLK